MQQGTTAEASATVTAADGTVLRNRVVTWQTSDTAVLGAHDGGELRALSVGVVSLVAIVDGVVAVAGVSVTP